MEIHIRRKEVYGKMLYYPFCDKAITFCVMLGTKTLSRQNLELIEKLGFTIIEMVATAN